MKEKFCHAFSDGTALKDRILFPSNEYFRLGMNDIPILAALFGVVVIGFCLMESHVHFVLFGTVDNCRLFIARFKQRAAFRLKNYDDYRKAMRRVNVQVKPLKDLENVKDCLAYVLRNPVVAGLVYSPNQYPWCSAGVYFNHHQDLAGKKIATFSRLALRKILKTHSIPDPDLILDREGFIKMAGYINYRFVNNLFGTPGRLNFYLNKKVESLFDSEIAADRKEMKFTIASMRREARKLANESFGKDDIPKLSMEERFRLAGILKETLHISAKKAARVLEMLPGPIAEYFSAIERKRFQEVEDF
ncbi:MAG: hypothetical protein GX125_06090 [Bacteroidales bacterium]|jgi:hypothetical protein|nr:hypothetical protein [Bacteroidales bacterium]